MKLTQERLKEVLDYNPETGIFHRLAQRGKRTGYVDRLGYIKIGVDGSSYLAHRLAWLYVYGYFPENFIDHIDRNSSNNRITNLREVSHQCNMRNCKRQSSSSSDIKGVMFRKGLWFASIRVEGKNLHLVSSTSKYLAAKMRYEAELKYGYVTCDMNSEAKSYLEANSPTYDDLATEEAYRNRVALGTRPHNTSGIRGVSWNAAKNKWTVQVPVKGEGKYLGSFESKLKAAEIMYAAELEHGLIKEGCFSSAKKFMDESKNYL
jgi:hypothetical protein